MCPKPGIIHQRELTRIVRGARAAGLTITALKIDKDGSVVLFSGPREREEREAPRLPIGSNEWDEVLKK
jgi:hypothetical protein